jgi:tetratricopeptide (TPR) repeat protein
VKHWTITATFRQECSVARLQDIGENCSRGGLERFLTKTTILLLLSLSPLFATNYVAYSLRAAQLAFSSQAQSPSPSLRALGGITKITGVVYDPQTKDLILIGERRRGGPQLTLDDFVVALRSRLVRRDWPGVSIDPTTNTARTGQLNVRLEGGIEASQFGKDLFEADYLLKRIGLGLEPSGLAVVPSHWSLVGETVSTFSSKAFEVTSRFWFYPVLKAVKVRENVATVGSLKVKVFTEVLTAKVNGKNVTDLHDLGAEHFAKNISDHFDALAGIHPAFARVQALNELVAVTRAIEVLESSIDFEFWLTRYQVAHVVIPKDVIGLGRTGDFPDATGTVSRIRYQGGVLLQALAIRLNAGDITALRDIVLRTRPNTDTLTWGFTVAGEWIIPGGGSDIALDAVGEMNSHATFLLEQKHYADAINVYDSIAETAPLLRAEALSGKATALFLRGIAGLGDAQSEKSIRDALGLLKAMIRDKPDCSECLYKLGYVMNTLGMTQEATAAFAEALRVNPHEYRAHLGLGIGYYKTDRDQEATAHLREYLKYDPSSRYADGARDLLKKIGSSRQQP